MQLKEKTESKNKSKEEKGARLRKIEKAVVGIASRQKAMARALTMIAKDMGELRRELGDTDGAISELNRTLNDMHQETREDLVKLMRAATPRSSPRPNMVHISKRWQRFKETSRRPGPQIVIHNGVETEVVDISTPSTIRGKNTEEPGRPVPAAELNNGVKTGVVDLATPEVKHPATELGVNNEVNWKPKYEAPPGFYNSWTTEQKESWARNNMRTIKRTMPGSFETEREGSGDGRERETANEVAEVIARMPSPSAVALTPTPPIARGKRVEYDSSSDDSLSEQEKTNINPVTRRYLRTVSPTKILSKSTTPEEDRVPVKIWPAKLAKLSARAPTETYVQIVPPKSRTTRILTDKITRDVEPAVPMVVVPLAERRRLEDEYVERKWDPMERGSLITDYSAGPDSPTREVTPGKIEAVANELAVIKEERERGVEVERNWAPMAPTPSPAREHSHPASPTPTQEKKTMVTEQRKDTQDTQIMGDPDDEHTSKVRPARAITPAPRTPRPEGKTTKAATPDARNTTNPRPLATLNKTQTQGDRTCKGHREDPRGHAWDAEGRHTLRRHASEKGKQREQQKGENRYELTRK